MFSIIENGIRLSGMPAFGGNGAAEEDGWKLVLFLWRLPRLTAAEELTVQHLNPKGPAEMLEEKQEDEFLKVGSPGPTAKK